MPKITAEFQAQLDTFIAKVNAEKKAYNAECGFTFLKDQHIRIAGGTKYLKLEVVEQDRGAHVWGFVSLVDGTLQGAPVKIGDLLKAASWKTPAKHARGNILDGTAKYSPYGPEYMIGI